MSAPTLTPAERMLLDQLFDKWSLLVLDAVCTEPRRFSELRRDLDPITPKALSGVLKRLETDGFLERRVVADRPIRIEYEATALGRTLEEPMRGLFAWVIDNLPEVEERRSAIR